MIIMENVTKKYPGDVTGVSNISLHIQEGEFVFVVGKSGSGKSTLMKLLLKELDPDRGKIYINKKLLNDATRKTLPYIRRNIGVVFQDFRLLDDRSVFENIAFAQKVIETPAKDIKKNVLKMLSMVGLLDKYKSNPKELSGGEQQRVAIARALVNRPKILLCDEPTGNLDSKNGAEVMNLLTELNREGTTIIMVTHSQHDASFAHRTVHLFDGSIVASVKA